VLTHRRPELIFLAALLALAIVVVLQWPQMQPPRPGPAAIDRIAPAPLPRELSDPQMIDRLRTQVRQAPTDPQANTALGLALLQQVRETGDPSLYAQAQQAFTTALQHDPAQVEALIGQGIVALAQHQFTEAVTWGERAQAVAPNRAAVYGVLADAYTELGQYEQAVATVQRMVDLRPDLNSYSRAAYQRELHGDPAGAIEVMELAVDAGAAGGEHSLWTRVQLGNLYLNQGNLTAAELQYRIALTTNPDYPYAQAGLAHIAAARGEADAARTLYRQIVARLPLPEFVIAFGEWEEALGNDAAAEEQYAIVRAMQQLNAAAGVDVDLELARFETDHGVDPAAALALAQAAYARQPNIYAADTLAWALYRNGDYLEAQRYSAEALRLSTQDARLHYHAGMIAYANGATADAHAHLTQALAINPYFSPLRASEAQRVLEELNR
jgi:tetratricopeptide (TPR) repeat protein